MESSRTDTRSEQSTYSSAGQSRGGLLRSFGCWWLTHQKQKQRIATGDDDMLVGSANPAWKGEDCNYKALHMWVRRWKGAPKKCTHCESEKNLQWANVSGTYKRDLDDFIALCAKCHRKNDWKPETGMKISASKKGVSVYSNNPAATKRKLQDFAKQRLRDSKGVFIRRDGA